MDGGCGEGLLADGLLEKDINLAIATYLRDELDHLGYDTIMTRDELTFPRGPADDGNKLFNPNERASYANTLDIDYYISIHVNSFVGDSTVRGMRIYFKETSKKTSPISDDVAYLLGEAVYAEFPDDKKPVVVDHTNETSFAVIRETVAPASLVEVGFATNETDAANMVNPEWQKRIAKALALGIDAHFGEGD
jgi:N-acetylmuramoyl-L-alanine amidase